MAQPITWRGVSNAGLNSSANTLARSGANLLLDSVKGLSGLAQDQRQQNISNQNSLVDENTTALASRLKSLGSMEDYSSAVESGAFGTESLDKEFGAGNYDAKRLMEMVGTRDNEIMQEETDRYNHDQTLLQRKDAPLLETYGRDIVGADDSALDALKAKLGTQGMSVSGQNKIAQAIEQQRIRNLAEKDANIDRKFKAYNRGITVRDNNRAEKDRAVTEDLKLETLEYENTMAQTAQAVNTLESQQILPPDLDLTSTETPIDAAYKYFQGQEDFDSYDREDYLASFKEAFTEDKTVYTEKGNRSVANTTKVPATFEYSTVGKNGEASTKKLSFQELPSWVVSQSLKEVGHNLPMFSSLFDKKLGSAEKRELKEVVRRNLNRYASYESKKNTRDATVADLRTKNMLEQIKYMNLRKQREKEYDGRTK